MLFSKDSETAKLCKSFDYFHASETEWDEFCENMTIAVAIDFDITELAADEFCEVLFETDMGRYKMPTCNTHHILLILAHIGKGLDLARNISCLWDYV